MKFVADILYVEFADLAGLGVQEDTIKKGILRKNPSWQAIDDPDDRRKTLIRYETLRDKYKQLIIDSFGDPHDYLRSKIAEEKAREEKARARQAISTHLETFVNTHDQALFEKYYSREDAGRLVITAAWLRMMAEADHKKLGFKLRSELYDAVLDYLIEHPQLNCKVKNQRVLQRKLKKFREKGPASIISKKIGNKNSLKLARPQRVYLRELYSDPRKFSLEQCYAMYLVKSREMKWPEMVYNTIRNYLRSPAVERVCFPLRHGTAVHRDIYDPVIQRKKPSFPDALWVIDGSPMELYYKGTDKNGRTRHDFRLHVFMVIDANSWKIVGYDIGESETATTVFKAMKYACNTTGYRPRQLQFDNSSAIKSVEIQDLFKRLCPILTPARVGNARAKVIEPMFAHFNERILKQYPNYAGGNITAKSLDTSVNREYLNQNKHLIPDKDGVIRQIHEAIATWNSHDFAGRVPDQAYAAHHPDRIEMNAFDQAITFWRLSSERKYTNKGISIEVDKEKHTFQINEQWFLEQYIGAKFRLYHDPETMEFVYLKHGDKLVLDPDGKPAMALAVDPFPMAVVDQKPGDRERLNDMLDLKKRLAASAWQAIEDGKKELIEMGIEPVHGKPVDDWLGKETIQNRDRVMKGLEEAELIPVDYGRKKKRVGLYDSGPAEDE